MEKRHRALIVIGGREDKKEERVILKEVVRRVNTGKLVICTAATNRPEEAFSEYRRVFRNLGVKHIHKLHVEDREDGRKEANLKILDDATAIFFTGGDQLKITSQLGDTPVYQRINDLYQSGGTIIGNGLDENTAVVLEQERHFYVLGSGAAYVLDGSGVTDSNIAEQTNGQVLSIYDIKMHVLAQGDKFDFRERRPRELTRGELAELMQT